MDIAVAYYIYGSSPRYPLELRFSWLSLLNRAKQEGICPHVTLYTDHSKTFSDWPFEVREINHDQWLEWIAPQDYIFRSKNRFMAHFLKTTHLPTLFFDTDTYFKGSLKAIVDRVSDKSTLMYCSEGLLTEYYPYYAEAYKDLLPSDTEMWNSGVVGLMPQSAYLIDEALELLDRLYARYVCFQAEQLALGEIFRRKTLLKPADKEVEHYYGHRLPFALLHIKRFFHRWEGASDETLMQHIDEVHPGPHFLESVEVEALPLAHAGQWSILQRDAYQALRMASPQLNPDRQERDIWRQTALRWLKKDLNELSDPNKPNRWRHFLQSRGVETRLQEAFWDELDPIDYSEWEAFKEAVGEKGLA